MAKQQQNSTDSTALTVQQHELIAAIVAGTSISEAAQRVQCDRSSYYVWIKDENFEAELNRAKLERAQKVRNQVSELVPQAIETMRTLLTSEDVPAVVKLKAATTVLQSAFSLTTPEAFGFTDPENIRRHASDEWIRTY